MEYLVFTCFFALWFGIRWAYARRRPKALRNKYIQNPTPLYPEHTKESVAWLIAGALLGTRKPSATTHGIATFMSQKELEKLVCRKKNHGFVIDGTHRLPLDFEHYAIIGGSGSGKTSKFLINNLLQTKGNGSIVVSDPSKEVFDTCAPTLVKAGYDVQVINFESGATLCCNPLSRANSSKQIMQVADIIVRSSIDNGNAESFWIDGAATILAIIIKSLKSTPEYCNLANVRYILNLYNPTDNRVLDQFMETHLTSPLDMVEYKGFMANEVKIISGFISSAKMSLKSLLDDHLSQLTSRDTIDFTELRRSKTALFIQYPENQTQYYSFLIKLLYSQLFDMCMQTGMSGQDDRPITVYLEEFANIGALPDFSALITTLRKRNVCVYIFIQALEQVEQVYPRQSEAILYGGINRHLFLNSLSQKTCEQLSDRIGSFTVEDNEKGTRHARALMTPSELRLMDDSSCLMMHKNHKPALFRITPYYKNKKLLRRIEQDKDDTPLSYPPLPILQYVPLPPVPPTSPTDAPNIQFDL